MKKIYLNLVLVLALFSCTKDEAIDLQDPYSLDAVIESEYKLFQMPGVAYAAVRNDSVVHIGAKGFANVEEGIPLSSKTRMKVASVSKPIVATAIMQLYDNGLIDLDENVNNYLPFAVTNPHFKDTPITTKMLLTHTSSVRDGAVFHEFFLFGYTDYPESIMSVMENFLTPDGEYYSKGNFFKNRPGSEHNYSNYGTSLLACIVEHVSGQEFNSYCKEHIFQPLGMDRTTWYYSETPRNEVAIPYFNNDERNPDSPFFTDNTNPSSGLMTTVEDLSKFMRVYMGKGSFNNIKILEPETVDLMLTVHRHESWVDRGLMFEKVTRGGVEVWGHTGGDPGTAAEMFFDKATNSGYIVIINRSMMCKFRTICNALLHYASN